MARSARLLDLLQLLRRQRAPVRGADLARGLGISLRSLYRDIATLQAQGADIEGSPGIGYLLRPGSTLPPLMFSRDELDAVLLGLAWVADRGEPGLREAAADARGKIAAVLPAGAGLDPEAGIMLLGPGRAAPGPPSSHALRQALRGERVIEIAYRDQSGRASRRRVWPCAIAVFDQVRVLVAWCELRRGFRHFRLDRIGALTVTGDPCPRRRALLLAAWRREQGIAGADGPGSC